MIEFNYSICKNKVNFILNSSVKGVIYKIFRENGEELSFYIYNNIRIKVKELFKSVIWEWMGYN